MQATIGNLCPEIAAIVKNAGTDASAALREERKLRRFTGYQKEPSVYEKVNLTEGCRVGRKDAEYLSQAITVDRSAYGRISRQLPQGIPLDQKGSRVVDVDFWREAVPVNGGFPKRANKTIKDEKTVSRLQDTRKRCGGLQVHGMAPGNSQKRTNNPKPVVEKPYFAGVADRKARPPRPMRGLEK